MSEERIRYEARRADINFATAKDAQEDNERLRAGIQQVLKMWPTVHIDYNARVLLEALLRPSRRD